MNTRSKFASCFVLAVAAMAAQPAAASVVIATSVDNNLPTNAVTLDFNPYATSLSSPGTVSPGTITIGGTTITFDAGAYLAKGNIGSVTAAPYVGLVEGPDTNAYLAAEPNANITLTFSAPQDYFGLLWGSVDTYNTLTFYNGNAVVKTLTGGDVLAPANGNQGYGGSIYLNAQFTAGDAFDKVVASSTSAAFEFDYVTTVPEPGTWFLMLFGFGAVGFALRSRKLAIAAA